MLPGLEGRCHDAGWSALCTGGDGRDPLRLAASRAIQRGDLARCAARSSSSRRRTPLSALGSALRRRLGLDAALAEASRGPVARAAAQARDSVKHASRPWVHAAVDFSADVVKPLYEGVERAFEAIEAPAAGVTHANTVGTPPRWQRRRDDAQHPPPPL